MSDHPVGRIIKPGERGSFVGKPEQLDPKYLVVLGQYLDPKEYPELFDKLQYRHGQQGDNFRLPDMSGEIMGATGGPSYYQSEGYTEGYQNERAAAYPIIRARP